VESGKSWLISARPGHKVAVPNRGAAWRLPPRESGAELRGVLRRAGDRQTEQTHAARVQGLARTVVNTGTAVCGTACTVVWEGGGGNPAPYPINGAVIVRRADFPQSARISSGSRR
jgi:hypothetical protein